MRKNTILISITIIALALFTFFFLNNISSENKTQIIKFLNIELNNLPNDRKETEIEKEHLFENRNFIVKFKSSKDEIDKWIERNRKIVAVYNMVEGKHYYLLMRNQERYFVNINGNDVEITTQTTANGLD